MSDGKHTAESVADVLNKAADLIEPDGRWTQFGIARLASGEAVDPMDDGVTCMCALGAIERASGGFWTEACEPARETFKGHIGSQWISQWNDAPKRTQAEVVQALRDAARSAILRATGEETKENEK